MGNVQNMHKHCSKWNAHRDQKNCHFQPAKMTRFQHLTSLVISHTGKGNVASFQPTNYHISICSTSKVPTQDCTDGRLQWILGSMQIQAETKNTTRTSTGTWWAKSHNFYKVCNFWRVHDAVERYSKSLISSLCGVRLAVSSWIYVILAAFISIMYIQGGPKKK